MKLIVALCFALFMLHQIVRADVHTIVDATPEFIAKPATRDTLQLLRDGGYVLFMRHGKTDTSRPDRLPTIDLDDCSTQRPLTIEGLRIATYIGHKIRKAKIPVGEVFSSPLCRAKETALAAFGEKFTIINALMFTSNMTDKDKVPAINMTRELISKPVEGKVNRVFVAHAHNMMEVIGYFPKIEGTVVIFKPMGDKQFKYIASISPDQWGILQP